MNIIYILFIIYYIIGILYYIVIFCINKKPIGKESYSLLDDSSNSVISEEIFNTQF